MVYKNFTGHRGYMVEAREVLLRVSWNVSATLVLLLGRDDGHAKWSLSCSYAGHDRQPPCPEFNRDLLVETLSEMGITLELLKVKQKRRPMSPRR